MKKLLLIASLVACDAGPAPVETQVSAVCEGTPPSSLTDHVYRQLKPQCIGCHDTGVRGYFSSLAAFQSLLVSDPRLVVPGNADGSELVRLLEGRGTGAFKQMPIGGQPYAADDTAIRMSEVRDWITGLGAQARSIRPDPDAPVFTRMSAAQIQRTLYQQLGLTHEDFFQNAVSFDVTYAAARNEQDYPFQSPDEIPQPRDAQSGDRFFHLGGGAVTAQVEPHREVASTFVHSLTAISQRWCRIALAKRDNTALFPAGTAQSRDPLVVKATIKRWSRKFHGATMSDAEIDALHDKVFVPLIAEGGTEPAHVGLCSYFIRHPRWIFY